MNTNKSTFSPNPIAPQNGLFIKLAVVSLLFSFSSVASYLLSFKEDASEKSFSFSLGPGVPGDEAILYSFLYGLASAYFISLFMPRGNLRALFTTHFGKIFTQSLPVLAAVWIIGGWGGYEMLDNMRSIITGENEWFQISLILICTSFTFYFWHLKYHNKSTHDECNVLG